ncbi:MAG: single-stranded DNA-binding protein [Muribaculaceae bacterium]|nr:single-stranded DNA-binding protein [Muribaculaceae bacterium]
MSVNKVILLGNVGKDPEIRYIQTRPIATFSLATNEPAPPAPDGQAAPPRTEWHNIVMWDAMATTAERYIRKGTRLYVEGKLRHRVWQDRNAISRTVTEIYVDYFEILG